MGRKEPKQKKDKSSGEGVYKGVLDITRSGMGYVVVEDLDVDILVRPNDFNTALHGDKVRVKVLNESGRSGRMQGQVTEVVERKQMEFLGRVEISKNFAFFIPEVEKPMPDIYIPLDKLNNATPQDRVLVKITEWEKNKKPQGEVVQVMDATDVNDLAMKDLIMTNGFPI